MKILFIILLSISLNTQSNELKGLETINFYKKILKDYSSVKKHNVKDNISKDPLNTQILEVFDSKKKRVGFIREIITSTGCNSACLPIIATFFYNQNKQFITLQSSEGLTKKNHEEFTTEDYQNLDFILLKNPKEFKSIINPKEMVDAITSETLKSYKAFVIKEAAYSTLRLNLYNQDTLKLLKSI
jgi:hypothetical protein